VDRPEDSRPGNRPCGARPRPGRFGPVVKSDELATALGQAVAAVEAGDVAVVDVRIEPGYGARDTAGAMVARN
jgi:hypothetical protein